MKIDQMLLREDFYSINENTLQSYFKTVCGVEVIVSTSNKPISKSVFVYPRINAIISRYPSKNVRKYIFTEFSSPKGIVENLQWKFYVALCLFTGGFWSSKVLNFMPVNPINDEILIWPCNRKIRIFNFSKGYVDSIIKEGFTDRYFNKEVSFRLNSIYHFVPKIARYGDNWYREELLYGQPLSRVKNKEQLEKSRLETLRNIEKLVGDTLKYVKADEYSSELMRRIDDLLLKATNVKNISTSEDILNVATIAKKYSRLLEFDIPVALSHGDLQSGNIWVDTKKGSTYIIDWETNAYRSIWYDPATFLLSIRRNDGVYDMISKRHSEKVKSAVLINDSVKTHDIDGVVGIIVLEDIIFCLEDNLELQSNWGKENIDELGRQLGKIEWI